ncbi:hypothetical protein GOBAR_AA16664 [Gossypium barbadense]|uniref:Uncharacterized protein n=2 Tax=Gossypium TaxID=3633 RepID=A0A2P5XKX6_GOSBA|nr:hypothetical protein GOBAR_AA16664 [Gossypium barbadense]TYI18713.1 hypothetical protein ES332_A07G111900v1 [Gossypium tomentosum]
MEGTLNISLKKLTEKGLIRPNNLSINSNFAHTFVVGVVVKYFVHLASYDDKAYSALENVATMMLPLHNGAPFQQMTSSPPGIYPRKVVMGAQKNVNGQEQVKVHTLEWVYAQAWLHQLLIDEVQA